MQADQNNRQANAHPEAICHDQLQIATSGLGLDHKQDPAPGEGGGGGVFAALICNVLNTSEWGRQARSGKVQSGRVYGK